jgi:hypothetical protein
MLSFGYVRVSKAADGSQVLDLQRDAKTQIEHLKARGADVDLLGVGDRADLVIYN